MAEQFRKYLNPGSASILLVICWTLLHLVLAAHLSLTADEAHYALYGRYLSLSYFDHPPLVGWLQALILPVSHTELALRLWPLLFHLLFCYGLYQLARQLFPHESPWIGFITLLIAETTLMLNILGTIWLPQVPLMTFGLFSFIYILRLIRQDTPSLIEFIVLGIFLGLAALSDYTAIFIALSFIILVLLRRPAWFKHCGIYVTGIISLMACLPILMWNIRHNFASFTYQSHHIFSGFNWSLTYFLQSQLLQFIVYSPLVYVLGIVIFIQAKNQRYKAEYALAYSFVIPFFTAFIISNGLLVGLPHWTALGWILLLPFIADYVIKQSHKLSVKLLSLFSLIIAITLQLFLYIQAFFHPFYFPLGSDPFIDLYGWRSAAIEATYLIKEMPEKEQASAKLFVPNWSLASRLAWYGQTPVQIADTNRGTQFHFWFGDPSEQSHGILVVPYGWNNAWHTGDRKGDFKECHWLKTTHIIINNHLVNQFNFYDCNHFNMGSLK